MAMVIMPGRNSTALERMALLVGKRQQGWELGWVRIRMLSVHWTGIIECGGLLYSGQLRPLLGNMVVFIGLHQSLIVM